MARCGFAELYSLGLVATFSSFREQWLVQGIPDARRYLCFVCPLARMSSAATGVIQETDCRIENYPLDQALNVLMSSNIEV